MPRRSTQTLGSLLTATHGDKSIPEAQWIGLIDAIAAGDLHALLELFERTREFVFAFLEAATASGNDAQDLTLDVFEAVWQRASTFSAVRGTVIAWIMEQARSMATEGRPNGRGPIAEWLACRSGFGAQGQASGAARSRWQEPQWQEVGPDLSYKLLAHDTIRERASMLVRLTAGGSYPPHRHAGLEQLYLLEGELIVDERKLQAGEYIRADEGSDDERVWSETGCMCVLVTSTRDELR